MSYYRIWFFLHILSYDLHYKMRDYATKINHGNSLILDASWKFIFFFSDVLFTCFSFPISSISYVDHRPAIHSDFV